MLKVTQNINGNKFVLTQLDAGRWDKAYTLSVNGVDKLSWGALDTSCSLTMQGLISIQELIKSIPDKYLLEGL